MLWLNESKRGSTNGKNDGYSICCMRGKVKLPVALKDPPPLLKRLIKKDHPKSEMFIENIRRYNSMFAFTSMGVKIDHSVNKGRGPYCFRLHGENYHMDGSLLPDLDKPFKFSQLYIFDTANEIQNRVGVVR